MDNKVALRKNIVSNVTLFFLNAIIGFWMPRYLVDRLGFGAYGMIPLSNTIIGYASVMTVAINGTLSRFLALDLANDDHHKANRTFNTAFVCLLAILTLVLPGLLFFSYRINDVISVPNDVIDQAIFLFSCISVSFVISTFTSVFNSSAYVANRLDLVNRVSLINTYVRVILILFIFLIINVSLHGYGIAVLIGSICSAFYSYHLFKKYTPHIAVNLKFFDSSVLKGLLSMGGWLVVIQVGSILFNQIDLVVVNKFFGNEEAGKYSIVLQISVIIRTFATTIAGALGPLILNLYAKDKFGEMVKLTKLSNKSLSLFVACIVGVLIVVSPALLGLWINPEFSSMSTLMILMIAILPINLGVMPLFSINRAYNKVKWPGIVTSIMGVLNIVLAILLVKYSSLGVYSVAIAGGIVLTLKNFIYMPIYTAKTMGISRFTFFSASLSSMAIIAISLSGYFLYNRFFTVDNWLMLIGHSAIIFSFLCAFSYLTLNSSEKSTVMNILLKKNKK